MFELKWRIIPNFIIVVPLFYGSKILESWQSGWMRRSWKPL